MSNLQRKAMNGYAKKYNAWHTNLCMASHLTGQLTFYFILSATCQKNKAQIRVTLIYIWCLQIIINSNLTGLSCLA